LYWGRKGLLLAPLQLVLLLLALLQLVLLLRTLLLILIIVLVPLILILLSFPTGSIMSMSEAFST
jgi:hypothetical protein